ncbi:MAG TPA: AAA family ATPase [Planctomycetota bacterium]|nr:AAA family ATPase [Planctomycetota bacterium]
MSDIQAQVKKFRENVERLNGEIGKIIVGQREIVDGVLVAIFSGGHILLEGLPGLGKTQLIKTVADALDLKFSRIQCTPDLMPADILGTTILNEDEKGRRSFEFQRGPIFGNIVLTDEINRATPKTQSALLQAMQEGHVTVGNTTHPLAQPFFVLATQNPIELEGTYPLPEAQLDRFMLKLLVPASDVDGLVTILERTTSGAGAKVSKVLAGDDVLAARALVANVPVAAPVLKYAARLVLATHPDNPTAPPAVRSYVKYGSSPRGAQAIVLAAKVYALQKERFHVAIEDIQRAARPALRHRLILNFEGEAAGVKTDAILDDVLKSLKEA